MRPSATSLLLIAALSLGCPLSAQETVEEKPPLLLSVGGDDHWTTGANGLAVGWTFSRNVSNVTISARLANGGGYAGGTAYLTRSIGPATEASDQIAATNFELPTGFQGPRNDGGIRGEHRRISAGVAVRRCR